MAIDQTPEVLGWYLSLVAQLVKNPPANAGDAREAGSIPKQGRSLGEVATCSNILENSTDRGGWWVTVHGVTKSWT